MLSKPPVVEADRSVSDTGPPREEGVREASLVAIGDKSGLGSGVGGDSDRLEVGASPAWVELGDKATSCIEVMVTSCTGVDDVAKRVDN